MLKIHFYFLKLSISNSLLCDFPQDPQRDPFTNRYIFNITFLLHSFERSNLSLRLNVELPTSILNGSRAKTNVQFYMMESINQAHLRIFPSESLNTEKVQIQMAVLL